MKALLALAVFLIVSVCVALFFGLAWGLPVFIPLIAFAGAAWLAGARLFASKGATPERPIRTPETP